MPDTSQLSNEAQRLTQALQAWNDGGQTPLEQGAVLQAQLAAINAQLANAVAENQRLDAAIAQSRAGQAARPLPFDVHGYNAASGEVFGAKFGTPDEAFDVAHRLAAQGYQIAVKNQVGEIVFAQPAGYNPWSQAAQPTQADHAHPHHHAHAAHTGQLQQRSSPDVLNKETNARFWAQTNYKVGQKLDMSNPTDKAMSKVWLDINAKVKAEDASGQLVTTYDHPEVAQNLQEAEVAHQVTVAHVEAANTAVQAGDQQTAQAHVNAAHVAQTIGQNRAQKAAKRQPPTVSPTVVQNATQQAHQAARQPPPGVIVYPVGHPVHWHPSAKPAHPELAAPEPPAPDAPPPQTAEDHVALAQTNAAPAHAANVHEQTAPGGTVTAERHAKIIKGALIVGGVGAAIAIGVLVAKAMRS